MFVSVTRLRLRSIRYLPGFVYHTFLSRNQLMRTAGFEEGRLIADGPYTFWTITLWRSAAEMRAWRGAGAHGRAMPLLAGWCDEAGIAHWDQEDAAPLPDWRECYVRIRDTGRKTPVDHPSANQTAGIIPVPDFRRERLASGFRRSG